MSVDSDELVTVPVAVLIEIVDKLKHMQNQLNRWEQAGVETLEKAKGNPMLGMILGNK